MDRVQASVDVAAPARTLFPYLLEPELRLQWVDGLVESTPEGDGRYREVVKGMGRRLEIAAEVVEVDEPRVLVVRMDGREFEGTLRNELAEEDGATRVTITLEPRFKSFAARLGAPIALRALGDSLEKSLARLKQLVE